MADEEQDPFAFIVENCRCSSSQEELLSQAKFAREDDRFSDDGVAPEMEDTGVSGRKLNGADECGKKIEDELLAIDASMAKLKKLGFRGERKGESSGTKLKGSSEGQREIELELEKNKVSPLVHCSGKMVIEGEVEGKEIVVFKGDLKVEKSRPLCSGDGESGDCTEKLGCEGGGDDAPQAEGEMRSGTKRKLELGGDTEVIDVVEEGEIEKKLEVLDTEVIEVEEEVDVGKKSGDGGEGSGDVKGDEKRADGTSAREEEEKKLTKRRKRELPGSMFGLSWGMRTGYGNDNRVIGNGDEEVCYGEGSGAASRNGEIGNAHLEGGSIEPIVEKNNDNRVIENGDVEVEDKQVRYGEGSGGASRNGVIGNGHLGSSSIEPTVENNRDGKSECGEEVTMKRFLDIMRLFFRENSFGDVGKVDIFETAKRCGLTFPRSRFLPEDE